jgi:hypothetical protein
MREIFFSIVLKFVFAFFFGIYNKFVKILKDLAKILITFILFLWELMVKILV